MNSTKNRMGGFISARIVKSEEISSFTITDGRCLISLKTGKDYTVLDISKNGVDAQTSSSVSKSGKVFNINIKIELKDFGNVKYNSFNKYLAILELPSGESHVFGTPNFPLTISEEFRYSKTPGGRVGGMLSIVGKQPNNVLILN